jgi:DNA replication regulator DPB11
VKNRPDIVLLRPQFISQLFAKWQKGDDFDLGEELEMGKVKVFEGMVINITNMRQEERSAMIPSIESHGGKYVKDLSRSCTHLITPIQSGEKYKYATLWSTPTVVPAWVFHSLKRGAALPERYYKTGLPDHEIGKGAVAEPFVAAAAATKPKESRDAAKPVLRKRRQPSGPDIFDTVLGDTSRPAAKKQATDREEEAWQDSRRVIDDDSNAEPRVVRQQEPTAVHGMFSDKIFEFEGFDASQVKTLEAVVVSHGGQLKQHTVKPANALVIYSHMDPKLKRKKVPKGMTVVTEWAIERSLHKKKLTLDFWGEFIVHRNVPGFQDVSISISGFSGVELLHLERLVEMLGARYQPVFVPAHDLLISTPGAQKFQYAKDWGIPIVNEQWLWECARRGTVVPLDSPEYVIDGLHQAGRVLAKEHRRIPPPAALTNGSRNTRSETDNEAEELEAHSANQSENSSGFVELRRPPSRDRRLVGKATVSKLTIAYHKAPLGAVQGADDAPATSQVSYVDVESQQKQKLLEVLGEPSLSVTAGYDDNKMTPAVDIVRNHSTNDEATARSNRRLRAKR